MYENTKSLVCDRKVFNYPGPQVISDMKPKFEWKKPFFSFYFV